MKPIAGLFTDCIEQDQPQGTYRYAKNIVDSNLQGIIENEDGFIKLNAILGTKTLIGVIPIQEEFVVFSTDNTDSEIGVVVRTGDTLAYTVIYNDPDLSFDTSAPIKGEYRKNIYNEKIVVWVDDINVPRSINLDNPSDINSVNDLEIFPDIQNPELTNPSLSNTGGTLKTGGIIPITRYEDNDGTVTNWFIHQRTFYINDDSSSSSFNEYDGAVPGTTSTKSLTFTLENCDTRFQYVVVGYIQSINNVLTAVSLNRSINNINNVITITGNESSTDITLDEVLTPKASYTNAKAITQLAGRLYLANLKSPESLDLQSVAVGIKLDYTSFLLNVISNTGTDKDVLPPTFIPGEVYAFYLGVELKKGGWNYYHIPGRPPVGIETSTITNEGLTYKKYQVDNTTNAGGATTNMGYWENENEFYPNDISFVNGLTDLRNQPVRHHRFPTTGYLCNVTYNATSTFGITQLPRLGVMATNVVIPEALRSKIVRWKIFFAKKTLNNSLYQGSDLLQFGGTNGSSVINWSTGGNWRTNFEDNSGSTGDGIDLIRTDKLRGHSLDMLLNKGVSVPAYALFNYKLRRTRLNTFYTGFRNIGALLTTAGNYSAGEDNQSYVHAAVLDYTTTTSTSPLTTVEKTNQTPFIKSLTNFVYIPENAINNNVSTQFSEGIFSATINTPGSSFNTLQVNKAILTLYTAGRDKTTTPFGTDGTLGIDLFNNGFEDTMYMEYFNLLKSVHNTFQTQELIQTTEYALPTETALVNIQGGDGYTCHLSFLTAGPRSTDLSIEAPDRGIRIWRGYLGYSRFNLNYRYINPGDVSAFYYGKTDPRTLFTVPLTDPALAVSPDGGADIKTLIQTNTLLNKVTYDQDYNLLPLANVGVIKYPLNIEETEFPNTIIYSPIQNEESKEFSWGSFSVGDRFVLNKNRGDIVNIQGFKNRELIIHTVNSIFRSRTDANASVDNENIFLKSANLFDLPPEELQPTQNGYGGTQHKFACVLTKIGYVYPDDKQGKVFIYTGDSLDEISTKGMRNFFRDFMQTGRVDNPFLGSGYLVQNDERTDRIILSSLDTTASWTISYNVPKKSWTSYHDYIPDYMFTTTDTSLYSVKNNIFYLNNSIGLSSQKGVYYIDDTPFASSIDLIFNENPLDKQFIEVAWNTEMYPSLGTEASSYVGLIYDKTFTSITLFSKDHCTGEIPLLTNAEFSGLYEYNVRNLNRTWFYNDIRDISLQTGFVKGFYDNFDLDLTKLDINSDWYERRKFVDKFLTCRFKYDNIDNNRLLLSNVDIDYRNAR